MIPSTVRACALNNLDPQVEMRRLVATAFQRHFSNLAETAVDNLFREIARDKVKNPYVHQKHAAAAAAGKEGGDASKAGAAAPAAAAGQAAGDRSAHPAANSTEHATSDTQAPGTSGAGSQNGVQPQSYLVQEFEDALREFQRNQSRNNKSITVDFKNNPGQADAAKEMAARELRKQKR